jgi:hypothetical protein
MYTIHHEKQLIARVQRVRSQIEAVERAIQAERGCEAAQAFALRSRLLSPIVIFACQSRGAFGCPLKHA